jgi:triacylglycerol lipase
MFVTLIFSYHRFNTYSIDLSPSNPVVFCHGLLGFDSVTIGPAIAPLEVSHWRGIKEVLEQNGTQVLITRVPATSSPVDRAKVLEQKVSAVYPGRDVHLIGKFFSFTVSISQ